MAEPGNLAWPVLSDELRVPDDVLANAYASINDVERSWIKKNIAQLYALHPPAGTDRASTRTRWNGGFATTSTRLARPWACLVYPEFPKSRSASGCLSKSLAGSGPAGVAAALVPVMTAGITDILTILHPSALRSAHLLTTLELCGLENVYAVTGEAMPKELNALVAREPAGLILDMGGLASHDPLSTEAFHRAMVWRPRLSGRLRIWCAAPDQWDWSTLEWNHPRARIEAWGPCRDAAPDHFLQVDGNWDAFRRLPGALGVDADMLHAPDLSGVWGLPGDGLILTPGQEGCWYWPDLDPSFVCFQNGMALADSR
ncbi:hypothetical protein [Desulfonatronum sp. SC1]|uniref:hypothetical protein n=1 Tax=Desulfonatronum sp. SC1 TaxID=2109626 RepID=UPI000D3037F6|nr:hypothetical protein [Desulfonatronum sp. SC1]PTN38048.1 hypothetical protein C6366_04070 [Desulfonatronum sp. SC1]